MILIRDLDDTSKEVFTWLLYINNHSSASDKNNGQDNLVQYLVATTLNSSLCLLTWIRENADYVEGRKISLSAVVDMGVAQ